MAEVNVIDWHVHPFRVDRWYEAWMPAFERARSFGAISAMMTRSEDDPQHFRQTTIWESRADFERFWASDEATLAREQAINYFNKPVLPSWHVLAGHD
jgi:heme-degrading monooxygenase HmoA